MISPFRSVADGVKIGIYWLEQTRIIPRFKNCAAETAREGNSAACNQMGKIKKTDSGSAAAKSIKPNGVTKSKPVAAATSPGPGTPASAAAEAPAKKTVKKIAAPKAPKTPPAASQPAAAAPKIAAPDVSSSITTDDIALRAYFIAERRRAKGLPGNEHQDWIDAERELRAEAGKPARTKRTA